MRAWDYLTLVKQSTQEFALWYRTSSIGHRNFVWVFVGCLCGYAYGSLEYIKKKKGKGMYADLIYVDEFIVDENNIRNFEKSYNHLNIQSFKSKGYEYTKLFKAINLKNSPLSYLQLRLWNNRDSYEAYLKSEDIHRLTENMKKQCIFHSTDKYETIVDDSIVRLIP
ncbi:conserved Plasmodium protein, unknown function [Plasmodium knowlesi strain H]|uniref:ABM domain-containing protein n=3 Tax=Plasmodium knowlesi TaxID=5850 RepID=A0A5K1V442_PLAKH|nr:conserved protein, unknown function [Plasmodium knowlesi strain H]OTN66729.1 Uncharacterized protein PKNOH_S08501100 [Plasmodium knowlesi]CAA9986720.1 conserved protein, unknown function [Plasmodium knowlesi strain H]SBO23538.1 conserved Plasmodium protein, unknown function [Plasmodium knowlesi strain H]SBO25051.1 conserved Plasmodium protein, unknown function [Plasmodium knowlesi strain H]VVS76194.1 conserved protein, unknown function [Plasmodium knowlesi strain H]|eukprot:XP_002257905.1 hypothetical protein, conserved in Plasmodium species [Plasmodium knowlesi strain H]